MLDLKSKNKSDLTDCKSTKSAFYKKLSVNLENLLGYIPLVVNMKSHNKCQKSDTTDALGVNSSTFETFGTFDKFDTFRNIVRSQKYSRIS